MKTPLMTAAGLITIAAAPAAAQFGRPPSPFDMGRSERPGTFDPGIKTERDAYDYSNASAKVRVIADRIERAVKYNKISYREADSLHRDLRQIVRMEENAAGGGPDSAEQRTLMRAYDSLDSRVKLMERNDMLRDRNRAEDGQFRR